MSSQTFLESCGFVGDPFASTNSENEESLADYFVPPPYFESVLGSPKSPKSTIVFAPRGSGKTAQRRMIEIASGKGADFACVTYTNFAEIDPLSATLSDHQRALCRLLTVAALSHIADDPSRAGALSEHNKQVVKYAASALLSDLNQQELEIAISSVKSLGDKAADTWRKYGGFVAVGIAAIMKKFGFDGVNLPAELSETARESAALAYLFPKLLEVFSALGFHAVYILVDKLDETSKTANSAERAFELISPLLLDLTTVEQPGVAFKFFLWDLLESPFVENGGRGDRLGVANLHWTVPELMEMLSRRVAAFSDNRITSFNQLVEADCDLDVHRLLAYLSPNSPRDMIRMCEKIVAEHTRQPDYPILISTRTVLKGIHEFAKIRSQELFGRFMKDLTRLPQPSFTNTRLASDVFKISTTAVRNKIVSWIEAGAVEKIGEESRGAKPLHKYAFRDPRTAVATAPLTGLTRLLESEIFICPSCSTMLITSTPSAPCKECGAEAREGEVRSLLRVCARSSTGD
ncbi:hypothetical protein [Cellulomonas sp. IC4_254]|uniref:P-loop ATPase, Sll1717 family n=1 Tax=Cellulomonas sp. IC4_254 TaxID=2714040 RepID=UPI00141E89B5|nr:hypothetical protein [Cellulomonas sp. IC4_254]NHT16701.1 hypothetical protein [Cellulomonas sp. IC4_254]